MARSVENDRGWEDKTSGLTEAGAAVVAIAAVAVTGGAGTGLVAEK